MANRSHNTNLRRKHPAVVNSFQWESNDLGSGVIARLGGRPFFGLVSIVLFFLLLSFACDKALGSMGGGTSEASTATQQDSDSAYMSVNSAQSAAAPQTGTHAGSSFFDSFGGGAAHDGGDMTWRDNASMLALRLTLASVLGAVLAFRPRRFSPSRHRNPCVVQTQVLLSIVACALMMIVGDSAARALGIFAAASLVRFRTSIRDPKEITVLLVALGVGLAAGAGRWELATMFTLFVLVVLEILENYEHQQAVRMMELSVKTHDVVTTDDALRELFRRNNLDIDIKELNKQSEKQPVGNVVYSVDLGPKVDTERLAAEIYLADPVNIDRVEWHKKAPSVANGS